MAASSKKILIIGSYPANKPRHGGQKRVEAIVKEYRKHFKDVRFVAVYSRWANPKAAHTDIPVSHQTDHVIMESPRLEEIICGEAIYNEPKVKRRLAQLLLSFRPDIIQVEQPYPYIGLKPLLEELKLNPKVIYDAHNVEFKMKPQIYRSAGLKSQDIKALTTRITELETELVSDAALTVAVSDADLADYRALGTRHLVLARNGIYHSAGTAKLKAFWRKHFKDERIDSTFLYVASAHLPNWTGFLDIVSDSLGFLTPNMKVLIAGGLSDYLSTRYIWPETPGAATFWNRAEACGILSEDSLGSLITAADVMILPITSGGGSNLKTAEALLSGKPIIATSYAFRAYEQFSDLPTVTIADTPASFHQAMIDAVTAGPTPLTAAQHAQLEDVTWPKCLSALVKEVASL